MAKASGQKRIENLKSDRKWYVGGGRRVLWAPEFPVYLDAPGFWDPGTYLEIKLASLLTYAIVEGGQNLRLTPGDRTWYPDRLECAFKGPGLRFHEQKTITDDDAFTSTVILENTTKRARTFDVFLWGRVNATDVGEITFGPVMADRRAISGNYIYTDEKRSVRHELVLRWSLRPQRGKGECTSFAVQNSEMSGETPDWRVTPFYELFDGKVLPDTCHWRGGIEHRPGYDPHRKWVFVALHRRVKLAAGGKTTLIGACEVSAPKVAPQTASAVSEWRSFFDQAPEFRCSDPLIEKYYDYRWYGLRLNTIDYGRRPISHPCVFEGINPGWFRHAISYSAQVLPRDCRWLHDPTLGRGCVLNFFECQDPAGFIHGALMTEKKEREWHAGLMYHSDWGGVVQSLHEVHPDGDFLKVAYAHLGKYADWFDRERDADDTGLYDICNQAETGQEYMNRYLFVDPKADEWGPFRLKGVDATVYVYKLHRALAWMAEQLGRTREIQGWNDRAERTRAAVLDKMWDPKWRKFCDVHPKTMARCPVKSISDFYPFLTDIAGPDHLAAIYDHLLSPEKFWTEWPAPATAINDEKSDAYGRWLGKRMNCPWNGRTWLMTNSHIADVLARSARELDTSLEPYAVTFITRFIHMLFVDRDVNEPTSYEYYNPLTGQAPFFRGVDDYMHSYIIDLIIRHVVGLQPQTDGKIVIEPLQFGLTHFALDNCRVAGQPVSVKWDGKRLSATVGRRKQSTKGWGRLVFEA